jgi:hypothetical protein
MKHLDWCIWYMFSIIFSSHPLFQQSNISLLAGREVTVEGLPSSKSPLDDLRRKRIRAVSHFLFLLLDAENSQVFLHCIAWAVDAGLPSKSICTGESGIA